jgi:hypothetical protein
MKKLLISVLFLLLTSCVSSGDYYKLDDQYLVRRQIETKRFETISEEDILIASAQVLQDLGFNLEESETRLGLITASKDREAGTTGGKAAVIFFAVMGGTQAVYDVNQKIYATLVSTKSKDSGFNVRIQFARAIWNNMNQMRMEKIQDSSVYKDFFDRLSQSIFLTANHI